MSKTLHIKNMVCSRCVMAVENILNQLGINYEEVQVGEIRLAEIPEGNEYTQLKESLDTIVLELIDKHNNRVIEKAKHLILLKARNEVPDNEKRQKLSYYLTEKLHLDYSYLSGLFSSVEGRSIEHYFISQRIERAKELLVYDELTLSEIAYRLDYSSVAHLSAQFKKTTGLTPSYFKGIGNHKLRSLDQI